MDLPIRKKTEDEIVRDRMNEESSNERDEANDDTRRETPILGDVA